MREDRIMRSPPLYVSWTVAARSPEEARHLQRRLAGLIDLDRVFTDTVRTAPDGVEQVRQVPHRLGDYFAAIHILPGPGTSSSFRLVFRRLPQAGRFWKDLVVNVLEEIKAAPEAASVVLDYKGDEAPLPATETAS
jgi:hypothetical protein